MQTADELMCLSKISKRVVKSNVNVVNAQCFYPFKANIETTALQGPDQFVDQLVSKWSASGQKVVTIWGPY